MELERTANPPLHGSGVTNSRVRRDIARATLVVALVLSGIVLFRVMEWPRSMAGFMAVFFFLQIAVSTESPAVLSMPSARRLLSAVAVGVICGALFSLIV